MRHIEQPSAAFTIRLCSPAGADDLAALGERLFVQAYGASHPEEDVRAHLALNFDRERLAAALAMPHVKVYLAEDPNGELIGYAHLCESLGAVPAGVHGERKFEIVRFYVDAAWHGRGVANALMEACLREAWQRGGDALWLDVWQKAARPIAFYRRQGFRVVGSASFLIGSRIDTDFIMMQRLRPQGGVERS